MEAAKKAEADFDWSPINVFGWNFRLGKNIFDDYAISDYPPKDKIPKEFFSTHNKYSEAVSSLFFKSGTLSDHGFKLRVDIPGLNPIRFKLAFSSMLRSFSPSHEHKIAAAGWFLSGVVEDL